MPDCPWCQRARVYARARVNVPAGEAVSWHRCLDYQAPRVARDLSCNPTRPPRS